MTESSAGLSLEAMLFAMAALSFISVSGAVEPADPVEGARV